MLFHRLRVSHGEDCLSEKEKNAKKKFSTASMFFICVFGTLTLTYCCNCWQITVNTNPIFSNVMLVITGVSLLIWVFFKFPIFINVDDNDLNNSSYEKTYVKNLGFWSRLYFGLFGPAISNKFVTLLGKSSLRLQIEGRFCIFNYIIEPSKPKYQIFDIALTIVCSVAAFFLGSGFVKFDAIFEISIFISAILFMYRRVLLNYIFSINIGKHEGYKLNVMYPYSPFDGIFSTIYGFAYDIPRTILLHKDIFCGGEELKKYVLAHEEGHLATRNPKRSLWITIIFIFVSFVGIAGPSIIFCFLPISGGTIWLIVFLYFLFVFVFDVVIKSRNKKDEFKADVYAIKKIGKNSVLEGLRVVKNDNLYYGSNLKFSDTLIDRRIEFVQKYQEQ